jgi:hypothetical protein
VVVICATPPLTVAVPSDGAPTNWTVPVAVAGTNVTVSVTGWPEIDVVGLAAIVAVVFTLTTVTWVAVEVLAALLASPL